MSVKIIKKGGEGKRERKRKGEERRKDLLSGHLINSFKWCLLKSDIEKQQKLYSIIFLRQEGETGGWDRRVRPEGETGVWDRRVRQEGETRGWDRRVRQEGETGVWDRRVRQEGETSGWDRRVRQEGETGGWDRRVRQEGETGGWDRRVRQEGETGGWDRRVRPEGETRGWDRRVRQEGEGVARFLRIHLNPSCPTSAHHLLRTTDQDPDCHPPPHLIGPQAPPLLPPRVHTVTGAVTR